MKNTKAMDIVMLSESLGSGGAERQMCTLAVALKKRGHRVKVATYSPGDFYLSLLKESGVEHCFLGGKGTLDWVFRVRRFLSENKQDAVVSFLRSASNYAEVAGLPCRSWGLISSERLATPGDERKKLDIRKRLHLLSDFVITNSHTNRLMLGMSVKSLMKKTVTVYNAVDLEKFRPTPKLKQVSKKLRLTVAARINAQKNILGLIEALRLLRDKKHFYTEIEWFGNTEDDTDLHRKAMEDVKKHGLENCFRIHPSVKDIGSRYCAADAVILPSFYEGLPNTVCEAMACGRPILLSSVCDAGNLVKNGVNGFLFDPNSPGSIADAICNFSQASDSERSRMGQASRSMAEILFAPERVVDKYESIIHAAAERKKMAIEHWFPEVPETAYSTLKKSRWARLSD